MTQKANPKPTNAPRMIGVWSHITGRHEIDLVDANQRLRERSVPSKTVNLSVAQATLDSLLDRLLDARNQLDSKAALIIPSIGAIGAIAAIRVNDQPPLAAVLLGAAAIVAGVVAVIYSIAAIWAADYQLGPGAEETALQTSFENTYGYRQAIIDQLALAIMDTNRLILTKATRVNRSLLSAGIGVILLLANVGAGGWK